MAASLNKVSLIGFVGKDVEARVVPSNSKEVVSFTLATSDTWRDRTTGEFKNKTEWHNIVIWNPHLINLAKRSIKKGSRIYVEGELNYKKWQDKTTGANHLSAEVVLQNFSGNIILLDKKDGGDGSGYDAQYSANEASEGYTPPTDTTDEVPF